jgi:hypothetical protein
VIHRDLGYVCVGLTLVYAVSGVAVNHVRDWNPNYRITRDTIFPCSFSSSGSSAGMASRGQTRRRKYGLENLLTRRWPSIYDPPNEHRLARLFPGSHDHGSPVKVTRS